MRSLVVAAALAVSSLPSLLHAQAISTAGRLADFQVGAGYTVANSDYLVNNIRGLAFYSTIDFREHLGVELEFHQLNDPQPTKVAERTYEAGLRYVSRHTFADLYGKGLYGRGVFNFPQDSGNLAYNLMAGGGGVDIHVFQHMNLRLDYEYQKWFSGQALSNGLSPQLVTIGIAYHVPSGRVGFHHNRRDPY